MMPKRFRLLYSLTPMLTLIYTKSIRIRPSAIGYIAKSAALVGKGQKHDGYRECDIALERFRSAHDTFIPLIKVCNAPEHGFPSAAHIALAIILFMAGERDDAISHLNDLIATVALNSPCYMVKVCE